MFDYISYILCIVKNNIASPVGQKDEVTDMFEELGHGLFVVDQKWLAANTERSSKQIEKIRDLTEEIYSLNARLSMIKRERDLCLERYNRWKGTALRLADVIDSANKED